MNTVKEYFIKMSNKISFVQLKEGTTLKIMDYVISSDVPLPIVTDTLISEIKEGNLTEELKVMHLIEGIIYILGIDYDFKHNEQYKYILYKFNENIEDYILFRGLSFYDKEQFDESAIYFRALNNLNRNNINGLFNYGLSLEQIANKYMNLGQVDKGREFLEEATIQFESVLDIDQQYALAYYKLGYHYKYYNQYQKAKLMWEKYISLDTDQVRIQEIREQIDMISDEVDYEEGLNYLWRGQYEKALSKLSVLASKHKKNWNLYYMIGVAYKGLEEFGEAVEYFCEAINLGGNDVDLYNELGICLYTIGNINEAIEVFTRAIEQYPNDYKLLFNRGLMYVQLGNMEEAKEDIYAAYELNPKDSSVKQMMMQLESI